jgi:hypothetical protein
MFSNRAVKQSERILQLNWALTDNGSQPLRSYWSLARPYAPSWSRMHDLAEVCNAPVIERCETSVSHARRHTARSLTVCGK